MTPLLLLTLREEHRAYLLSASFLGTPFPSRSRFRIGDAGPNPVGPGPSPFLCLMASSSIDFSCDVESFDLECSRRSARTNTGSSSTAVIALPPCEEKRVKFLFRILKFPPRAGVGNGFSRRADHSGRTGWQQSRALLVGNGLGRRRLSMAPSDGLSLWRKGGKRKNTVRETLPRESEITISILFQPLIQLPLSSIRPFSRMPK